MKFFEEGHEIVELTFPKQEINDKFGGYYGWVYAVEAWVKNNIKELTPATVRKPPLYQIIQLGERRDMYRIIVAFNDPANAAYFSLTWL